MKDIRITFADGMEGQVISLEQKLVYEGLLEGLPTRERNDATLEFLRKQPRCYLVPPVQTPVSYHGNYPRGTPARLPRVQCKIKMRARGWTDPVLYETVGEVVWFQEAWAMPIDAEVFAHLETVAWRSFAQEYEM